MNSPPWSDRELQRLQLALLGWFEQAQRPLPWRQDRDAYRIWVSEVMLQQTTVAAVVSYFDRFLKRFPTLQSLAEANQDEVLQLWQGLGYYRRARQLHSAAQILWAQHGAQLPDDPEVWAKLPGIGPYMLGAVLSQAFDRKLPIVEANTLRVLTRWFAYREDPREGAGRKWIWQAAQAVLPEIHVGDFNQAMMELGALVCKIDQPNCSECPVARWCQAKKLGLQAQIPVPARAKVIEAIAEVAMVIRQGDRLFLVKRAPEATRWANMWEVPHAEAGPDEDPEAAATRLGRELTGLSIKVVQELPQVKYRVTRFEFTMASFLCDWQGGEFKSGPYTEGRWVLPADLPCYAISSPQRKLLGTLRPSSQQLRLF